MLTETRSEFDQGQYLIARFKELRAPNDDSSHISESVGSDEDRATVQRLEREWSRRVKRKRALLSTRRMLRYGEKRRIIEKRFGM